MSTGEGQAADPGETMRQAVRLHMAGDLDGAERLYKTIADVRVADVGHNLGVLYRATGRFEEAEAAYRRALGAQWKPGTAFSLSMLLLSQGRYPEGWSFWEARREALKLPLPKSGLQEWMGGDPKGKRLLVWGEQGFGDQIQFARFVHDLRDRGAIPTLFCSPSLMRLFGSLGLELRSAARGEPEGEFDGWVLVGSLPGRLGITLADVKGAPYLSAPAKGRGGIGFVATGNPTHPNDANRSAPPHVAEALKALGAISLKPEDTGARDFQDTAEIVAGLDLVISVDTSIVHLAGALGKPCWLMLPAKDLDWRWLYERRDTPWYDSVRLYRQATPGDWAGVLDQIREDLRSGAPFI